MTVSLEISLHYFAVESYDGLFIVWASVTDVWASTKSTAKPFYGF